MNRPTREQVAAAMEAAEAYDLEDGAYWQLVHDILGIEYGDVFEIIRRHQDHFGYEGQ